ncbi:MAG: hypothetical protein HRU00_05535, partial [Myxococcales bacterium]|nr:hypothetical protein [Myxococcales bacterium]
HTRTGTLEFETYAATRSAAGSATRFRVSQLPEPGRVSVLRDGAPYQDWRTLEGDAIEIQSQVGTHRFEVYTGYERGLLAARRSGPVADVRTGGGPRGLAPLRTSELAPALVSLRSTSLGCPCCG